MREAGEKEVRRMKSPPDTDQGEKAPNAPDRATYPAICEEGFASKLADAIWAWRFAGRPSKR